MPGCLGHDGDGHDFSRAARAAEGNAGFSHGLACSVVRSSTSLAVTGTNGKGTTLVVPLGLRREMRALATGLACSVVRSSTSLAVTGTNGKGTTSVVPLDVPLRCRALAPEGRQEVASTASRSAFKVCALIAVNWPRRYVKASSAGSDCIDPSLCSG
jgi:hypothetical protein